MSHGRLSPLDRGFDFELGEQHQEVSHHPARWRVEVNRPGTTQEAIRGGLLEVGFDQETEVEKASSQTVKLGDDQPLRLAGFEGLDRALQTRPMDLPAGDAWVIFDANQVVAEDLALASEALFLSLGRDASRGLFVG